MLIFADDEARGAIRAIADAALRGGGVQILEAVNAVFHGIAAGDQVRDRHEEAAGMGKGEAQQADPPSPAEPEKE